MAIYGQTPSLDRVGTRPAIRGDEIKHFLNTTGLDVKAYAIIDDGCDFLIEQLPHFFRTDPAYGLTEDLSSQIIHPLNKGMVDRDKIPW
jgi:hypothetical protein